MTALVILKAQSDDKYIVFPMILGDDVSLAKILPTAKIIPEWEVGSGVRDMLKAAIAANAPQPAPAGGGKDGQES